MVQISGIDFGFIPNYKNNLCHQSKISDKIEYNIHFFPSFFVKYFSILDDHSSLQLPLLTLLTLRNVWFVTILSLSSIRPIETLLNGITDRNSILANIKFLIFHFICKNAMSIQDVRCHDVLHIHFSFNIYLLSAKCHALLGRIVEWVPVACHTVLNIVMLFNE